MTTVLYLHGFCSSAKSTKADFLAQHLAGLPDVQVEAFDFNPTPVDFEFMTVTGCIDRLRQYLLERTSEEICFVGSSLGGLIALHYASRYPGIASMLLLAPAISYPRDAFIAERDEWRAAGSRQFEHFGFGRELPLRYAFLADAITYSDPPPPPCPAVIVHGAGDEVVPVATSRAYAAAWPHDLRLIEVDDDHLLYASLPLIGDTLLEMLDAQ